MRSRFKICIVPVFHPQSVIQDELLVSYLKNGSQEAIHSILRRTLSFISALLYNAHKSMKIIVKTEFTCIYESTDCTV